MDCKKYEFLNVKHTNDYDDMLKILNIVRSFIETKQRIVFGGQAIDYGLRLHGEHIYDDDVIPDYDFYSPEHLNDAFELTKNIFNAGFTKYPITIVRAIHITTLRVRYNLIVVADISYIPPNIFKKLPTLNFQGLKFIHPNFQKMDVHVALSTPFNNFPNIDFYTRFNKSVKRFNLINNYYKLEINEGIPMDSKNIFNGGNKVFHIHRKLRNYFMHGICAYGFLLLYAKEKLGEELLKDVINVDISFDEEGNININIPITSTGTELAFLGKPGSHKIKEIYNPIMGSIPRRYKSSDEYFTFYDPDHSTVLCAKLYFDKNGRLVEDNSKDYSDKSKGKGKNEDKNKSQDEDKDNKSKNEDKGKSKGKHNRNKIKMCNIQYILYYFLGQYYFNKKIDRTYWLAFYHSTMKILEKFNNYISQYNPSPDGTEREEILKQTKIDIWDSPIYMCRLNYGWHNISETRTNTEYTIYKMLGKVEENNKFLDDLPRRTYVIYHNKEMIIPDFDYSRSYYFQINGKRIYP